MVAEGDGTKVESEAGQRIDIAAGEETLYSHAVELPERKAQEEAPQDPDKPKKPSVMVAIPLYQFLPSYFFFSFLGLLVHLTRLGEYRLHFSLNDSQPLDRKRNDIVEEALNLNCDYILWLDSDMGFPPDSLDRLMMRMKEGRHIVSALNFSKSPPFKPVMKVWNDKGIRDILLYPANKVLEVDGVGMACCLVDMEVYRKLSYPYYRFLLKERVHESGKRQMLWLAEDLYFCMKAQDQGYKIHVDTGLKTRHIGGHGVGEDTYQSYKDMFKHVVKTVDNIGLRMDMSGGGEELQEIVKEASPTDGKTEWK